MKKVFPDFFEKFIIIVICIDESQEAEASTTSIDTPMSSPVNIKNKSIGTGMFCPQQKFTFDMPITLQNKVKVMNCQQLRCTE